MVRAIAKSVLRRFGYELVRFLPDLDPEDLAIIRRVTPYTMTNPEGLYALIQAIKHIARAKVPGCIVECGVWRGGSMMAAAYALQAIGVTDVDLYLFDTYEGMTKPTAVDISVSGKSAVPRFERTKKSEMSSDWDYASLEEVRRNLLSTGYDEKRLKFIKGRVEDTLPGSAPREISILRLDTDWYESTLHELVHLYPRLVIGGVLLLDDYGHWQGCRKAVDEYLAQNNISILLDRLDYGGRSGIKSKAV